LLGGTLLEKEVSITSLLKEVSKINRKQKLVIGIMLVFTTTLFSGCWNYREVNTLAIIMAAAVDRDVFSDEYILSIEVVRVTGGERSTQLNRRIYESRGQTIFDAARNVIIEAGRRAYWSHSKAIIINSSIAEEDISDVLDWFYRDQELRRDVNVFIFKGDRASHVLTADTGMDDTIGYNLYQTIINRKGVNKYPETELGEVVGNLSQPGSGIILPTIDIQHQQGKARAHVEGSAILKGAKVIGYLNPEETRDVLAVTGKLKKGVFPTKDIMNTGEDITMELYDSKNKTETDYEDDKVSIKINTKLNAGIAEITGKIDFTKDDVRKSLASDLGRVASESIQQTINKVQNEFQCDIFDFGTKMQIQHPKEWKQIKEKWNEKFSTASIKVNVDMHIRGSATASKPVKGD
jgi:spore germination protein KC